MSLALILPFFIQINKFIANFFIKSTISGSLFPCIWGSSLTILPFPLQSISRGNHLLSDSFTGINLFTILIYIIRCHKTGLKSSYFFLLTSLKHCNKLIPVFRELSSIISSQTRCKSLLFTYFIIRSFIIINSLFKLLFIG